jgi:hypothetical protein
VRPMIMILCFCGRASDRVSGLGQGVGQRLEKDEV